MISLKVMEQRLELEPTREGSSKTSAPVCASRPLGSRSSLSWRAWGLVREDGSHRPSSPPERALTSFWDSEREKGQLSDERISCRFELRLVNVF